MARKENASLLLTSGVCKILFSELRLSNAIGLDWTKLMALAFGSVDRNGGLD